MVMFRPSVHKFGQIARTYATSTSRIQAGILLQRSPIILPPTHHFESLTDQYFQWLSYQSAEKFPQEFFFKKGSSAERKWQEQEQQKSKEWYFSKGRKQQQQQVEIKEAEDSVPEIKLQPRRTKADEANDQQSLERRLDQPLYLLVKQDSQWQLPQSSIEEEEVLDQAARRTLRQMCGDQMSVWMVGRGPVGHLNQTFYLKAHILAGQVQTKNEYKWLAKEEIQPLVSSEHWDTIKQMI